MAAELFVLGSSQSVASSRVRERMHVDLDEIYAGLRLLRTSRGLLDEAVPLATCGRLEVYGLSAHPRRAVRALRRLASTRTGLDRAELATHSYLFRGDDAVRHLYRVASGLDSVIYGEAQILGQVRQALQHPATDSVAGTFMKRLFQDALAIGKRVRSETSIGRGPASVAGAAIRLLETEIRTLHGRTALILGAGETGALIARLLRKAGVSRLVIANRTLSKATQLAAALGGEARALDDIPSLLADADIIVGAVAGRERLVTVPMLSAAMSSGERSRHLLDLAHPRNFEAGLAGLPGVRLLDLARIFEQVESAKKARAAEVPLAESIVDTGVRDFAQWTRARDAVPVLRAMREQVLSIALQEAERRARGRSEAEREDLIGLARSLARTLLHSPTVALREADPSSPEGRWLLRTAPALFGVVDSGIASGGGD